MRFCLPVVMILALSSLSCAAVMAPTTFATVGLTAEAPVIDASLNDPCWRAGACADLGGFVVPDMSALASVATTVKLCYDSDNLYLAAICDEPNTDQILAYQKERDSALWRDDCIEIFIDSNHNRTTFYQFIVNSAGALYDSHAEGDAKWNSGAVVKAAVGEASWTIELSIPFADLGGKPERGAIWGFNVGRERYAGEGHLSIWSPTYGKFHEVARYGELRFAAAASSVSAGPVNPMFGANQVELSSSLKSAPSISVISDWPPEIKRTCDRPEPTVTATGPGSWRGTYRLIDGSEKALVISQRDGEELAFRQAFPINLRPAPVTPALVKSLIGLEKRAQSSTPFGSEIRGLVGEARGALDSFVQSNLTRDDAMPAAEWTRAASEHRALYSKISDMVYVVWTKSPWEDLQRDEMPPSIYPPRQLQLTACVNETESADLIITNLGEQALDARLELTDLTLAPKPGARSDAEDLVTNGDFSADTNADGIPDGWTPGLKGGQWSLERQADGTVAFVISGEAGESVDANLRQTLKLTPGETYTFAAEISTEKLPTNAGFAHIVNKGWTWSSTINPTAISSPRSTYYRSFTAPDTEYFQAVLRLATPSGGKVRYHRIQLLRGGVRQVTFSSDCIRLHEAAFVDLRTGNTVADPLPEMDEAHLVSVPAGESRQIWVNLDTSALPPGTYEGSVTVTPFDRELKARSVPLRIRVRPVRLPDRMPIATFNWDYASNEAFVADLAAHRTNSFLVKTSCQLSFDNNGEITAPADWSSYDALLQVKLRHARENGGIVLFSYGIVRDFDTAQKSRQGWEFMSDPWKRAFRTWVLEFERHLRDDIGMDYDEYAVQLWDEATGQNADLTVEAGKFIRTFAPRIRTCMDGAQNVAEVKALDPVIDLWIPSQGTLYGHKERVELRALYQEIMARGEPVWTYTCSTDMKGLHPLDYYRLKEWRVWDLGLQGSCYWAYNSWRVDPWNDFDGEIADCGSIYIGRDKPVTSRRWEATLAGREDYLYLHMLREQARTLGGARQEQITRLIDDSVAAVLGSPRDIELFDATMANISEALESNCGTNAPAMLQGPDFVVRANHVTVSWRTDVAACGRLYYRIPGDAAWSHADFASGERHVAALVDLTPQRDFEWYLVWWGENGAAAADVAGLSADNRFRTAKAEE